MTNEELEQLEGSAKESVERHRANPGYVLTATPPETILELVEEVRRLRLMPKADEIGPSGLMRGPCGHWWQAHPDNPGSPLPCAEPWCPLGHPWPMLVLAPAWAPLTYSLGSAPVGMPTSPRAREYVRTPFEATHDGMVVRGHAWRGLPGPLNLTPASSATPDSAPQTKAPESK